MKKSIFLTVLTVFIGLNSFAQLGVDKQTFTRADSLRGYLSPLRTCYDINYYHLDIKFDIPAADRMRLLEGLDDIGLTLKHTEEIVAWERDTLQPKYGIPFGVEYAHVMGVAELYEYEWYFGGFLWPVWDRDFAHYLDIQEGEKVVEIEGLIVP